MSAVMIEYELGPLGNRTVLLYDPDLKTGIVIDPAFGSHKVIDDIKRLGLTLDQILVTHAHFDHIGGIAELVRSTNPTHGVHLHQDDLALWQAGGGAQNFGFHIDLEVEVTVDLTDRQVIKLGNDEVIVRHTPGHSNGHVIFIVPALKSAFVGDLIFYLGVGRTDLEGGNARTLIKSIQECILTLPDDYRLYPGHGPMTTVGFERENNPFL